MEDVDMTAKQRRERFVNLAEKRVTRAIKDIRLIGNLSNRSNYSYDEADVRKIVSALEHEVKNLKQRFQTRTSGEEVLFKL